MHINLNCREDITMDVTDEVTQGVKNPTRKQAWSVFGLVILSVATSVITPIVVKQIKAATKKVTK